jgi:hypothetical protein
MTQTKEAQRYVVTHTGVDAWTQGQVIDRADLKTTHDVGGKAVEHDRLERLLSLGAIRPATEAEAGSSRVPVLPGGTAISPAAQMLLATKDAEIARLTSLVGDQQDRLASHERLGLLPAGETVAEEPHVATLAAEKDAQIERLKARAAENEDRLASAGKASAERTAAARKTQEKEGTQPAAGQAPPADYSVEGVGAGPTAETAPKHGKAQHKKGE